MSSAEVDAGRATAGLDHSLVELRVVLVLLSVRDGRLAVLLIKRGEDPFADHWALPCGPIDSTLGVDAAAERQLHLATGVPRDICHVEQLRTYSDSAGNGSNIDADGDAANPAATLRVSVAYLAFMPIGSDPAPGSTAELFRWWPTDDLFEDGPHLAFDHARIVHDGVDRCRSKLEYTTVAASFLTEPFTLGELRRIYENVWGVKLHHSNFARKLTASPDFLVPERDAAQGRASLYRRGNAEFVMPPILRPSCNYG